MFHPWRGDEWGQASNALGGLRLLVVGDGPGTPPDPNERAIDAMGAAVTRFLDGERSRFLANTTRILAGVAGIAPPGDDTHRMWKSIAFHQYVPRPPASDPSVPIPDHVWTAAASAFAAVIRGLEVECVLVLGRRLWARMPEGSAEALPTPPPPGIAVRTYPLVTDPAVTSPYQAIAVPVRHPSAVGGAWRQDRPALDWLVEAVRSERARIAALTAC
ncbi:hypothetical protein [Azospirillum soli]|uniref:hypothetical protein n=1 Tax=Azospirillum soli TaxID=1304799 RepID=UPI001AE9D17D|nr:hypothetical protein [Azospirillum soli]MBP2316810.1 hypothetical protein [Azospirillum soli]